MDKVELLKLATEELSISSSTRYGPFAEHIIEWAVAAINHPEQGLGQPLSVKTYNTLQTLVRMYTSKATPDDHEDLGYIGWDALVLYCGTGGDSTVQAEPWMITSVTVQVAEWAAPIMRTIYVMLSHIDGSFGMNHDPYKASISRAVLKQLGWNGHE